MSGQGENGGWVMPPTEPSTISIDIFVGEDVDLPEDLKAALTELKSELVKADQRGIFGSCTAKDPCVSKTECKIYAKYSDSGEDE